MKGQSAERVTERAFEGEDIIGGGLKIIGVNSKTIKEMNITTSNINGHMQNTSNTCKPDIFKEICNTIELSDRDKYIVPTMPKSDNNVPLFINQMNFNS